MYCLFNPALIDKSTLCENGIYVLTLADKSNSQYTYFGYFSSFSVPLYLIRPYYLEFPKMCQRSSVNPKHAAT